MRRHPGGPGGHHFSLLVAAGAAALLLFPLSAAAAPPANDNRAAAEPIAAFPATIQGTTLEATVERLDPQVSQCGRVESTVWYRIDQAPDGTVLLQVSGTGLAPVLRVYQVGKSSIQELVCASAKAGAQATVGFETTRGASYLVLVGKRAGTADAPFTLTAGLFLPPPNDTRSQAQKLGKLPVSVKGSTLGATSDDNDPEGCGLAWGTVWYALTPVGAERLIVRLQAQGPLDAAVAVIERVRSEAEVVGCAKTDARGAAVLPVPVDKGATYLIVVGQRAQSPPGDFTLQVLRAQAPERAPGQALANGMARGTLNGLTDVNDVWWVAMEPGSTYRIALSSKPCVAMSLRKAGKTLRSMECSGYTTFTPGPDGGGRYVFELRPMSERGAAAYTLRVVPAGADDVGMGTEIESLSTIRGSLAPAAADIVDVYHFDVAERSDIRLRLVSGGSVSIVLLTDSGARLGSAGDEVRRQLDRGRYVVAVRAEAGAPATKYVLSLVIRRLTTTTLAASAAEVAPGAAVMLTITTTPRPDSGKVKVQVDRFDPLGGWQFARMIEIGVGQGSLTWIPPALGRWRVRATFTGTLTFSPSRSGYANVLVAQPLPLGFGAV
jgi:hypothetical protein